MKTLKKVLSIVFDVVIASIFVFAVIFLVSSNNKTKTGVSNVFGYSSLVVETNSMEPTIKVGDLVIGKMVTKNTKIEVGDIISFKGYVNGNPAIITHRVVEITPEGRYVTRGDNAEVCLYDDLDYKYFNDIICVYQSKINGFGKTVTFLKQPAGFALCFITPMSLFIIFQIFNIVRIYTNGKQEEMKEIMAAEPSDEVKDAIIKQYLEEMKAKENADNETK